MGMIATTRNERETTLGLGKEEKMYMVFVLFSFGGYVVLSVVQTSRVIDFTWNFSESELGAKAPGTLPLGHSHQDLLSDRCPLWMPQGFFCALVITTPCRLPQLT